MALSDEVKELGANLRTEYAAIEAYHRSLIHYRFIIVGAYMAGISFLAKPALEPVARSAIWACAFALLITVCAWMLELRTRSLYRKLALRGEQIEREYWGYRGNVEQSVQDGTQITRPNRPSAPRCRSCVHHVSWLYPRVRVEACLSFKRTRPALLWFKHCLGQALA
jgi:hypothetical protein